ncbi:c-type cytochrome [Pseudoteredinibacter isoporae]|uniref:Cytochrome c553 n=1 Tax=Pseudoteredinibacter isoporae TaxID=570281 RepID=A0A7X0MVU6_9GAMM|nr:c-type cytochrome [Pseudoteredinibacter isoporae]MBB6522091.1 cytochrome c553 [Pseudoteredinibacter isoporae]NHO87626.1 c-type cytochrome [Pseudoteredinibacter isoporae]NIB24043.1 c-type cytochrome [Pseudoteredinibacter isoporae]
MMFSLFKQTSFSNVRRTAMAVLLSFFAFDALAVDIKPQLQMCATCHGMKGQSSNEIWPNLAGQKAGYLAQEIRHIRDGVRIEPTMKPFVQSLTNKQIDALAEYYASQPRAKAKVAKNTLEMPGAHVRARCVSCHGMQGETVDELWPNLAGQKATYLLKQLRDYRSGKRKHPIMKVIAGELTDEQSKAVAEYYAAQ